MGLMSFILLVLLSLSLILQLENQAALQQRYHEQAKTNALLGLDIALGQLQANLGPDRRVSAKADILELNTEKPTLPENKHWTGAWSNEIEDFDHRLDSPELLNWLVSGTGLTDLEVTPDKYAPQASALAPVSSQDVLLVGANSAGADPEDHVVVPFEPIKDSDDKTIGSFAYWVGDEGVKARLNLANDGNSSDPVATKDNQSVGAPNRYGIAAIEGFNTALADDETWDTLSRIVSKNQANLYLNQFGAPDLANHFHDFSYHNEGLLTNTKTGGLRKDLSIAFEIEEDGFRNTEFALAMDDTEWTTNNRSFRYEDGSIKTTKPIYSEALDTKYGPWDRVRNSIKNRLGSDGFRRGPTWDLLRNHYRLYQSVDTSGSTPSIEAQPHLPNLVPYGNNPYRRGANGSFHRILPPSKMYYGNENDNLFNDYDRYPSVTDQTVFSPEKKHTRNKSPIARPRFTQPEIAPEIVRMFMLYSIRADGPLPIPAPRPTEEQKDAGITPTDSYTGQSGYKLQLVIEPYITVHNPYDVALEVDGIGIRSINLQAIFKFKSAINVSDEDNRMSLTYILGKQVGTRNSTWRVAFDYILTKNGTSTSPPIVFEPGETKFFTSVESAAVVTDNQVSFLAETLSGDAFNGGFYYDKLIYTTTNDTARQGAGHIWVPESDPWVNVNLRNGTTPWIGTKSDWPKLGNWSNDHNQVFVSLLDKNRFNTNLVSTQNANTRMYRIIVDDITGGVPGGTYVPDIGSYPDDTNARFYVGYSDIFMRPTIGDQGSNLPRHMLAHSNPRAIAVRGDLSGGYGNIGNRMAQTWGAKTNYTELTGEFPINALQFDYDNANGFWGNYVDSGGSTHTILYSVPTAPLLSIGELQHANVSLFPHEPAYVIGSSRSSPLIPPEQLWHFNSRGDNAFFQFDVSYLANEVLWDDYFFSGIGKERDTSGNIDLSSELSESLERLPETGHTQNSRIRFILPDSKELDDYEADTDLSKYGSVMSETDLNRPHTDIAGYLRLNGAFNINSTSVEAWTALLASMRGQAVNQYNSTHRISSVTDSDTTPFMRANLTASYNDDRDYWNALRQLTDEQIKDLATNIVEQVKVRGSVRGPAPSLARFVNRELLAYTSSSGDDIDLSDSGAIGLSGTIQAALDSELENSGTTINREVDAVNGRDTDSTPSLIQRVSIHNSTKTDQTYVNFPSPEAMMVAPTSAAITQHLSQADILAQIGPFISARSDTFKIRAYGDLRDPMTSEVLGQAWCEAVVQRALDYVDSTEDPNLRPDELVELENQTFGRRFEIVSFRWLNESEI